MEAVSNLTRNKWTLPVVGLILGIIIGVLYAWVLNPVEWVNGEPSQLRSDLQEDYLRMAIDSYLVNSDADLAVQRFESLGETGPEALAAVAEDPGDLSTTAIQSFRALLQIEGEVSQTPEPGATPQATEQPAASSGPLASFSKFALPVCGGTVVLGLVLAAVLVLRSRSQQPQDDPEMIENLEMAAGGGSGGFNVEDFGFESGEAMEPTEAAEEEPELEKGEIPPFMAQMAPTDDSLATFRTIYSIGDDDYDDSFSIESPTGDFLGECGVGIGDLIGVGEPNKVAAFEVWLFDKNDIQTVTKVLMSRYAYQDEETRNRLSAKGDPTVAEPGGVVTLQTASLEVEARIVDLTYGESALPSESFFERLTIELRAWSRDGAAGLVS